ncbi:MAG: manganese-binding transcriptional regulator MntR [Phycisphaerales bacterium]|nr:manganese-binding transcriptional regulator MntR [Phycisphaerales bacterium]
MATSRPTRRAEADRHARVRAAHASETAEDYVEAIARVIADRGACRVVDLVRRFGVSHVTVSRTVGRLVRDGLARTAPHAPIVLTPRGRRLALTAAARHELVVRFLVALGLDARTAEIDAEGIEHHVSPKTLRLFARFVRTHDA